MACFINFITIQNNKTTASELIFKRLIVFFYTTVSLKIMGWSFSFIQTLH